MFNKSPKTSHKNYLHFITDNEKQIMSNRMDPNHKLY